MPKFIVDLWLDGYDNEEEMEQACLEFLEDTLNFSGSCVEVTKYIEKDKKNVRTR